LEAYLFGAVNKAALNTMREAGKRYFEDFKNFISCFLLFFLTIRLVGPVTIHVTYFRKLQNFLLFFITYFGCFRI